MLISISSVIRMAQFGLLDLWKERHFLKSKCETGKRYSSGSILFSHIWLLLVLTAGCLAVCVAVFCLELKCVTTLKSGELSNKLIH